MGITLDKGVKVASVDEILATRSRATYSHRINFSTVGYGVKDQMNRWCEENCRGAWHSETYFALYWQFTEERDATMFMLRWGGAEGNKIR
jgi:hypothetical protein